MKKNCTAECMASLIHKFTQDWLNVEKNRSASEELIGSKNYYRCVEVRVHETTTGCAIADSSDEDDVCIYIHEDKN